MNLKTDYFVEGVTITINKENDEKIISKSIRLTNKNKQRVQNKRENLEDKLLNIARIENAKTKKQNFFNKHKK